MQDLLGKEKYCHKIHTLLMKSSTYPLLQTIPPILQENREPPLLRCFKNPKPPIYKREVTL